MGKQLRPHLESPARRQYPDAVSKVRHVWSHPGIPDEVERVVDTQTTERANFLAAIAAAPYDSTVRKVFADWLDEKGEHKSAALMRAEIPKPPPIGGTQLEMNEWAGIPSWDFPEPEAEQPTPEELNDPEPDDVTDDDSNCHHTCNL